MFGTAAAAQRLHAITSSLPTHDNSHGDKAQGILELLDGQFDALAAASSNITAALDQLASAITQQYSKIESALTNLTAAAPNTPASNARANTPPTTQRKMEKRILIFQAAVKNTWKVGGYCSTHGHGVRAGHSSDNNNNKKADHVDTATRMNPVGPGN